MPAVLVTGGAGFIGSNFVRHLRRERPDWTVVNLDKLTYAGNLESLADLREDDKHVFVRGDIADAELVTRLCERYGVDTRAQCLRGDERFRNASAPRRRAPRAGEAIRAGEHGRGVRIARCGRPLLRDVGAEAVVALLGVESGGRSARARVPPHVRPRCGGDALLEQLRAVPVPREAHSADDRQRARGEEAAGLRRRPPRARLDPRRGSLRRAARGGRARPGGRGLQRRLRQRVAEPANRPRAAAHPEEARVAHRARAGPPRSRSSLRHRCAQDAR